VIDPLASRPSTDEHIDTTDLRILAGKLSKSSAV